MKLYYSPGACSLASHIVLQETGSKFETEKVDLATKKMNGGTFTEINPKGYVPVLRLDNGEILTEGAAILQYIADQNPKAKLAPANGTMERYRLQEWLNFIATEVHKGFSPLWNSKLSEDTKNIVKERLFTRFDYLNGELTKKKFLMGDTFSVADAYLFTVVGWTKPLKIDISKWPALGNYQSRVADRPAVQAALKAEGLRT